MNPRFTFVAIVLCASTMAGYGAADDASPELLPQSVDPAAAPTSSIGIACLADSDCAAPATKCVKSVSVPLAGDIVLPGGHCTLPCATDAECGAGASCPLAMAAAFLPEVAQCLKQCTSNADCREGYTCGSLSFGGFGGAPPPAAGTPATSCLPPLGAIGSLLGN